MSSTVVIKPEVYGYVEEFVIGPGENEGLFDEAGQYVGPPTGGTFTAGPPSSQVSNDGSVDWTWDTTWTQAQEDEWAQFVKSVRRRTEPTPQDDMQPYIDVLSAWKNRTGPATDAQRDAVLDAMTELWRLTLKEED